ncbi:hypothetical protein [Hymenobacter antarcticus]|uniref:hypothetical protein n=1 Tax=Hymenobacter antarcticus TaxID=486270 RepID=UPI0031E77CAA
MKYTYITLGFALLTSVSCSKKEDAKPSVAVPPYARLNVQFLGYQGQAWLRGYDPANCSAAVTDDLASPIPALSFKFVATDGGNRSEISIYMERSKLAKGVVGTYTLGTDFYLDLKQITGSSMCNNTIAQFSSQVAMRTLRITAYDAASKRITGSFEAKAIGQYNPATCPNTSASERGDVEITGEFKNVSTPLL